MSAFLAWLVAVFKPVEQEAIADGVAIAGKVGAAFAGILAQQPTDQTKILHDSMASFTADIDAGKSWGEAASDALDTFYNEEKTEASNAAKALFQAFLAATQPAGS